MPTLGWCQGGQCRHIWHTWNVWDINFLLWTPFENLGHGQRDCSVALRFNIEGNFSAHKMGVALSPRIRFLRSFALRGQLHPLPKDGASHRGRTPGLRGARPPNGRVSCSAFGELLSEKAQDPSLLNRVRSTPEHPVGEIRVCSSRDRGACLGRQVRRTSRSRASG